MVLKPQPFSLKNIFCSKTKMCENNDEIRDSFTDKIKVHLTILNEK